MEENISQNESMLNENAQVEVKKEETLNDIKNVSETVKSCKRFLKL